MKEFEAFWVKLFCPKFGLTDSVVTSLRKGMYHVECISCGRKRWMLKEEIDKLEKRMFFTK